MAKQLRVYDFVCNCFIQGSSVPPGLKSAKRFPTSALSGDSVRFARNHDTAGDDGVGAGDVCVGGVYW